MLRDLRRVLVFVVLFWGVWTTGQSSVRCRSSLLLRLPLPGPSLCLSVDSTVEFLGTTNEYGPQWTVYAPGFDYLVDKEGGAMQPSGMGRGGFSLKSGGVFS